MATLWVPMGTYGCLWGPLGPYGGPPKQHGVQPSVWELEA